LAGFKGGKGCDEGVLANVFGVWKQLVRGSIAVRIWLALVSDSHEVGEGNRSDGGYRRARCDEPDSAGASAAGARIRKVLTKPLAS